MKPTAEELNLKVVFFDGITMAVPEGWRIRPGKDHGEWHWCSPDDGNLIAVTSASLEGDLEENVSLIATFLEKLGDDTVEMTVEHLDAGALLTATVDHMEEGESYRTFRWYRFLDMENSLHMSRFIYSVPKSLAQYPQVLLLNDHLDNAMRNTTARKIDTVTESTPPPPLIWSDYRQLRLETLYNAVNILIPAHWVTDISDLELAECFDEADTDENLTLSVAIDHFIRPKDDNSKVLDLPWLKKTATKALSRISNDNPNISIIGITENTEEGSVDCLHEINKTDNDGLYYYRCSRYFLTHDGFVVVNYTIVVDQKIHDDPETKNLISTLQREILLSTFNR